MTVSLDTVMFNDLALCHSTLQHGDVPLPDNVRPFSALLLLCIGPLLAHTWFRNGDGIRLLPTPVRIQRGVCHCFSTPW